MRHLYLVEGGHRHGIRGSRPPIAEDPLSLPEQFLAILDVLNQDPDLISAPGLTMMPACTKYRVPDEMAGRVGE
jgi:hypothetical protein